jgi:subtilisin family serine protease
MRFSVNSIARACLAGLLSCALFVPMVRAAGTLVPNDPAFPDQWYLRQIDAPGAWAVTTGSPKVTVAVIDSGVDFQHPDLAKLQVVDGWNFVTNSSDTTPMVGPDQEHDVMSHGTIVTSLLAAQGNDGIGMAGVAWNIRIMPLVVLDMNGAGDIGRIAAAIKYAVAHHADIINISLVGYTQDDALDQAIKDAYDAGVLVVAAAGNTDGWKNGQDLEDQPWYPACSMAGSKAVLTVSATDALDQKAPYANYGRTCVSLSAPGFEMLAAHPFHGAAHDASSTEYVTGVVGTSAAVPLVSGAAALIKSLRPDWKAPQIRARLLATTDPIDPIQSAESRYKLGSGRLNVARAVQGLNPPRTSSTPHPASVGIALANALSYLKLFIPSL